MRLTLALGATVLVFAASAGLDSERIYRPAKLVRGNTNVVRTEPVDVASWIWAPEQRVPQVLRFRRAFTATAEPLEVDVSADERFVLLVDGGVVGRGPDRGSVENWQYQSYRLRLAPGPHLMEAVCWRLGEAQPIAQLSWKGGFLLKASGSYDGALTTGKAGWEVGETSVVAVRPDKESRGGTYGVGAALAMTGTGPLAAQPERFAPAVVVRGPAGTAGEIGNGLRTPGWMLYPSQLPAQTEATRHPGVVRALRKIESLKENPAYSAEDVRDARVARFSALIAGDGRVEVPAGTRFAFVWDLGDYYCAYPRLRTSGGKGASVCWGWAESLCTRQGKSVKKGDRSAYVGKAMSAPFEDLFRCDGRSDADFTTTWWRCGRWCQLKVETADDPLIIEGIEIVESRYPLEDEAEFACPDASFPAVRQICLRAMQMCDHEMLFDCPFYEQQMYPGDTRVQLQVLSALSRDDRMIKRAIELFDYARRDDGTVPMNWPTRGLQESVTYTLCHLLMYGDYLMEHEDRAWLKARLPGMRHTLFGVQNYEDENGMLRRLPGWSFMDWPPEFICGNAPESLASQGPNSEINLFWVLAQQTAARVERAFGNEELAGYWDSRAKRLAERVVTLFWDETRGAFAEDSGHRHFSEHSQCLALLADVLPSGPRARCFKALVEDQNLVRCTVYFSYYLFETYFKFGRGDLFLKRFELWRTYVRKHLKTTQEAPDTDRLESRSDCHAWGAHPIWFMQTGLAGIRSAAPFFAKVRIEPSPGTLNEYSVRHPHPKGFITATLKFRDGKPYGRVSTPVPGEFAYGGVKVPLAVGENVIGE